MQRSSNKMFLKKTIATILVFAMVFQFVPNIVIAINLAEPSNEAYTRETARETLDEHLKKTIEETEEEEPVIIGELENERTSTEKHFLRSDGSVVASIFPSNIHYEKDGKLLEINNTLEEITDTKETLKIMDKDKLQEKIEIDTNVGNLKEKTQEKITEEQKTDTKIYTNKSGNTKINFTNKISGHNLGSIESEGHTITWRLLNSKEANINLKNNNVETNQIKGLKAKEVKINIPTTKLEYGEILNNINMEYSVEPERVKENIILKNKEAINNELKFIYDIGSLKMKLLDTKEIIIYDKNEKDIKFKIESPYMYDGKLEFSSEIDIKIEEQEGRYIVTLIPEARWLEAEERVYPVTIDPSIITSRYYDNIDDTFIYSTQGSDPKGNAHIIRAGNNSGVPTRTLLKFNLPTLKAGDQVIGAYLNIFTYPKTTEWIPNTRQIQLDVHKMTADWDENTAVWSNTNTNYLARAEDFILYKFDYNNQCKQYTFNVTTVAKEWYTTGNNYGVMIKEHIEANNVSGNEAYFISADTHSTWYEGRPVVQIIYRNQTGLEDYLSYHMQDLGRAGTIYTNDYNGNLVWVHNDISTPGERFPVTVTHIYNTNDKDKASRYGRGMRLNLSQTIELVNIGGIEYAEYTDEDGTRHYFTKEGNIYKDEDGLNLELTLDANTGTFTMKDKGDNIIRFERRTVSGKYLWHLKEIEDSDGNKIILTFLATSPNDFIISKITDGAGQSITFQYSGYYLNKMIDPDGRTIIFSYNGGSTFDIKYPDGNETMLDIYNNLLCRIFNMYGGYWSFEYYPEQTKRIKKIEEHANNTTLGNQLNISYKNNLTTFTDNKGFSNSVTFNDWGQAISVADFGKGAIDLSKSYGKAYNYGTEGGSKNKLTLDGSLTKSVNNLLMNGSAETDGYWQGSNWGNNKGTFSMSTTESYTGNRSLKITNAGSYSYYAFYIQEVVVPKGKTYTLSAKVKTENLGNTEGGQLCVYYNNAEGKLVRDHAVEYITKTNGWEEHSFTFTYPSDATTNLTVCVTLMGCEGTIYYDDIQLEEGTIANPYNMIENSSFDFYGDTDRSWFTYNATSMWDSVATSGNTNLFRLYGDTSKRKYVCQNVTTGGKAGDVFSVSAWVYAGGTRAKGNTCNTIAINIIANDNTEQWLSIQLNPSNQWQFAQQEFIAKHDYRMIQVYFCFYENVNEAYITKVALYKDHFGQSYQYDANGNIIKTQDLAKQNNTFVYDGNDNLIKYTNPEGGTFEYQYDTTHKHRLTKAMSSTGVNYNFTYNQYGQATKSKITNNENEKYIETNAEYTENGNYLTKIKDEKDNETTYEYNQTNGNLNKVTDAKGKAINYTYDTMGRIKTVGKTANGQNYQNSYTYIGDRIEKITHNGFKYNFIYDTFGNRTKVNIENSNLITNNYEANNGNLSSVTYGNGNTISYTYDRFNRMSSQSKAQGIYKYEYDATSNLAYVENPDGSKEQYTYDLSGRVTHTKDTNDNFEKSYEYDKNGNIDKEEYSITNNNSKITYQYDNQNRLIEAYMNSQNLNESNTILLASVSILYDGLSRPTSKLYAGVNSYYKIYYRYEDLGNNRTTNRISEIYDSKLDIVLSYTYDELGNIKSVIGTENAEYYYDELGQLVREDNENLGKTIVYTYDLGGNITSKTEYPYTIGNLGTATKTITYTYGNTNWKDQLTSYNNKAITYDAIGNPLTYDGNVYTWQNGRELKSITNSNNNLSVTYKYNDSGIRTEKTVNGITTKYYLEGTKVIYERNTSTNKTIHYYYDDQGDILGLRYNGIAYIYVKNLQGDVIGIIDNNKEIVVSYTYDSWGNVISIKDKNKQEITDPNNVGQVNPYRYRSYRYDSETKLYYLNSRYYNPEWGRFINGDGILATCLIESNLYGYCLNNPINYYDPNGESSTATIGILLGGIYALATTIANVDTSVFADIQIQLPKINRIETFTSLAASSSNKPGCAFYPTISSNETVSTANKTTNKKNNVQKNNNNNVAPQKPEPHFDPDQQALIELAKRIRRKGANLDDARTMVKWAKEYGVGDSRLDLQPVKGKIYGNTPHFHINGYHIPIIE